MKTIGFVKMNGAGNDFVIFDARKSFPRLNRVAFVKKICNRHFGVGADGVFFIERPVNKETDFQWDFYNADGSAAEMCGNGARCVARFAFDRKIAGKKMRFKTKAGIISATASKYVEVFMTKPKMIFKSVAVPFGQDKLSVGYWDTGVPHVVLRTQDWTDEYLSEVGQYLRHHVFFKNTNGANATFFEVTSPSQVKAATFERGVEGITLSCGTGAVAAALQAFVEGEKSPISVEMPGGKLIVKISDDLSKVSLSGPADYVFEGKLNPKDFL